MRRLVIGAVACAAMLAGCADDDNGGEGGTNDDGVPSTLLQRDDLPDVEKVTTDDRSILTKTNCADMDGEYNLTITDSDDVSALYVLADGDQVRSSLQGPAQNQTTVDHTLEQVDTAVTACSAPGAATGTFARIEGLPEGAVGFRTVTDTSEGPQTTERAYAAADDDTAVVVTVDHVGEGEPAVTAAELLPKALERARG
ncbi:hypothetical protein [Aeromicrobium sp. JJY06]|uniref:hypothetical protein n=1 Tax=Aeromicrobium sp. JJY06 TaxID=3373478 RepID=UPI00376ECDE1